MTEDLAGSDYDIIVAGGGMIGSALALALAPLDVRVAVIEAVEPDADRQPSFDDRSTALSRSTQRMFAAMSLWEQIQAAAAPITEIHVSDRGRFGFSHIDAREQGVEALGYVVINRVLGEVLRAALNKVSCAAVLCPARVVAVSKEPGNIVATVDSGSQTRQLSARLLVAADGARSSVRQLLGIDARHVDYGQTAIIGNLRTEQPIAGRAFERFTEHGPLAMLPVPGGRVGFVWTVGSRDAERMLAQNDRKFLEALQGAFGNRLGRLSQPGARATYPLVLSKAERLTSRRAVVIGNAAHGLHPVAAQGFNLGMRDVAALCDCIADSRYDGRIGDVGSEDLLAHYAGWRRADQNKLVGFTDGLVRLFGDTRAPVRLLRNFGMLGFDLIPGVRSLFAKHTMGLAGRLPRLSRGVPLT